MNLSLLILRDIKEMCKNIHCDECSFSIKKEGTENRNIVIGCKLEDIPSNWKIDKR